MAQRHFFVADQGSTTLIASILKIQKYKYTNINTQIQIHKYKYTNINTNNKNSAVKIRAKKEDEARKNGDEGLDMDIPDEVLTLFCFLIFSTYFTFPW